MYVLEKLPCFLYNFAVLIFSGSLKAIQAACLIYIIKFKELT